MKIPIIWLKDYININKSAKDIAESFTALGLLLDKPIELVNNFEVLDLEHRMDRADWLSIIGCARDLAAMENLKLIYPLQDEIERAVISDTEKVTIKVDGDGFVNRFYTRIVKNVKVGPSPDWLKERLESYGIGSINNLVDITNYVMVEYGQPMHAHDLDKMDSKDITFRKAKDNETITTLLGEKVFLDKDIWITTSNDNPTGIGGIVGGTHAAIDDSTTNIVLDSGDYDQTVIRKTSRKLKIYNETVLRNDKFLHPKNNIIAVKRACKLILDLCGPDVEIYENGDYYPNPQKWESKNKVIRLDRIKKISGVEYDINSAKKTLENLEYKVLSASETQLKVEVPYFRTDVEVEDDLVADILRINNYSNIEIEPIKNSPPKEITPEINKYETKLKNILVKIGLHEHITDPLVEKDQKEGRVVLENALTSEKSALRLSIRETLEPVLETYKKHKLNNFNIFEIGLTYQYEGDKVDDYNTYKETRMLEVIVTQGNNPFKISNNTKNIVTTMFNELGIENIKYVKSESNALIMIGEKKIGVITRDGFTIKTKNLQEIDTGNINTRVKFEVPNNTWENLSLIVDIEKPFGDAFNLINTFKGIAKAQVLEERIDENSGRKTSKSVLVKIVYDENSNTKETRENLLEKIKETYNITLRE